MGLRNIMDPKATDHIYGLDNKMIVTVPAYSSYSQFQTTENAGSIAGWSVLRNIQDPKAAELTYGLGKKKEMTQET